MLEGSSRLGVLSVLPSLSFVDMLHAVSGGFGTQWFPFLLVSCLFVCLDFDPCPLFLFLFFLGTFFYTNVGRVSSSINNVFKVKCQSSVD